LDTLFRRRPRPKNARNATNVTAKGIKHPKQFKDDDLIRSAKSVYQSVANSNPWIMGKNKACYAALYEITSIYQRLSE
jgi:hypothetical protein